MTVDKEKNIEADKDSYYADNRDETVIALTFNIDSKEVD